MPGAHHHAQETRTKGLATGVGAYRARTVAGGATGTAGGVSRLDHMDASVLVVDDDPTVAEVVVGYLRRAGMTVEQAADGPTALAMARARLPDLAVLDLMLPGLDGLEVCRRLRELGPVAVIMLTALGTVSDRVLGLELGADDYVTKPFSPRELVLRVQSVLRRVRGAADPTAVGTRMLRVGDIEVDVYGHRAEKGGQPLQLTGREFDLLAFFLANPGRAFSRAELLEKVWGWSFGDQSTVTVHVRRLREKIEEDPANPVLLATVWGVGYRLDSRDDQAVPPRRAVPGGARRPSEPGRQPRDGAAAGELT
jgi:DNA-binding response OmpR family regulator